MPNTFLGRDADFLTGTATFYCAFFARVGVAFFTTEAFFAFRDFYFSCFAFSTTAFFAADAGCLGTDFLPSFTTEALVVDFFAPEGPNDLPLLLVYCLEIFGTACTFSLFAGAGL